MDRVINPEYINRALMQVHRYNYENLSKDSPIVSIGYKQDMPRLPVTEPSYLPSIDLLCMEDLSPNMRIWTGFTDELKNIANELKNTQEKKPEIRSSFRYIPFPMEGGIIPGMLLLTVGCKPEEPYFDSNMYDVDEWGIRLIKKGLNMKIEPVWMRANYPFTGREGMMSTNGFNNQGLREIIESMKK